MKKINIQGFSFLVSLLCLGHADVFAGVKVGLVLDKGGKDDRSFNASAFLGIQEAEKKLGVQYKLVEATDDSAFEPMLAGFAKKDFDLIIGIGVSQVDAMKKVAPKFPNKKFLLVDAVVDAPNVRSVLFSEHEGSYLVGVLAAMKSKTGKIGFIGGMDIPLIRRFELGYFSGAKSINPKIKTVSNFVGVTSEAWNNPPKAKEIALTQYASGVDVIYQAAGASGAGLFDAAATVSQKGEKKYAIGVDSNQNWIKPGLILTSMLKRVDRAVFETCQDVKNNKFTSGTKNLNLADQGIDYALDENNASLISPEMKKKVDAVKAGIIAGKIKVPDFYTKK